MARLFKHELAFDIESDIYARLKTLRVPRPKQIAEEISAKILDRVPSEAFECKGAWESGLVFFTGDVEEDYVKDRCEELMAVHHNIKAGIPITIYLSSFGGSFEDGMALYSTIQELRRAGRIVNAHVQGTAMSMGSILIQGCDTRTIEPFATMMVHESRGWIDAKTSDARDEVAYQERVDQIFCSLYAQRSGRPVEFWREKIARKNVYLTAREAVSLGLVDRIRPIRAYKQKKRQTKASD